MIHFGFMAKVLDIKTAFLYGELEEEIYMKCPPDMKVMGRDTTSFWESVSLQPCASSKAVQ